jgi:hypothetical protein
MLTVVASGKAAPGVSTTVWALALSWPGPLLVADCDPAGGDLAAGLLAGRVSADRGLLSWSTAVRRGTPAMTAATMFAEHAVQLPERPNVWLLAGFATATQAYSFTDASWEQLGRALERGAAALGRDGLVDAGRLVGDRVGWPVLQAADRVLLAVRPTVRSVHAAQHATARIAEELGDLGKVSAVVIGAGPYAPAEVTGALRVPLAGVLPHDARAAAVLSDGGSVTRAMSRSRLMRAAAGVARRLAISGDTEAAALAGVSR